MKKTLLTTMIMMTLLFAFTACGSKEEVTVAEETQAVEAVTTAAEEETKTFTVGFDQDFPPMGFIDENGEFAGFDIDLATEAASRMGRELVLQPIAWDSKDMELKTENIDCVWNGFTINGREDSYTWTDAYMANRQVFVVRADSGIVTLADLAGKNVMVQADSSAEAALGEREDLTSTFGDYIKAADYNAALLDLESGAVDAVGMDEIVARYRIEKRGSELTVLDEALAAESYGVGFLLGNEALRDELQTTLEAMAADGKMEEISMTWFGEDITTIGK